MTRPDKTGGGGGPWVELEKPKPPPVADYSRYWGEPPPEQSERCRYWLRQIDRGWRPNRHIAGEGCETQAEWYGVYTWELLNVLLPLLHCPHLDKTETTTCDSPDLTYVCNDCGTHFSEQRTQ